MSFSGGNIYFCTYTRNLSEEELADQRNAYSINVSRYGCPGTITYGYKDGNEIVYIIQSAVHKQHGHIIDSANDLKQIDISDKVMIRGVISISEEGRMFGYPSMREWSKGVLDVPIFNEKTVISSETIAQYILEQSKDLSQDKLVTYCLYHR